MPIAISLWAAVLLMHIEKLQRISTCRLAYRCMFQGEFLTGWDNFLVEGLTRLRFLHAMPTMDGLYRARGGKSTVLADDRPVAKKVAWAVLSVAQGSELGFTATKAATRCEIGGRAGPEAAITSHARAIGRRHRSPGPAGWSREILWDTYASPRWAREARASLPGHGPKDHRRACHDSERRRGPVLLLVRRGNWRSCQNSEVFRRILR